MTPPDRVLLIFLDGVGIGPADPGRNPFLHVRLPTFERLAGGRIPTLDDLRPAGRDGAAFPLDATLDTEGTPQSGTGQTALLTGLDAGRLFGGHFGPWIPVKLRPLVEEWSVLRHIADAGGRVAFANAYPKGWPGPGGSRRIAGPPLAARGAGVLDRHEEALARGEAVSSEIVNEAWRTHLGHTGVPLVSAHQAGQNLAAIAAHHHLTLFAHYATDTAGHRREMGPAIAALERVDHFLEGVLHGLAPGSLLLITSDHGNVEDTFEGHTRNPVLGLASGPGAHAAGELRDLRQVAPFIRRTLGVQQVEEER